MGRKSRFVISLGTLLVSILASSGLATSSTSLRTSLRQQDEATWSQIAAQWVRFLIITASAGLALKAPTLWSQSRILRKLNVRNPRHTRQTVTPRDPDHAFVELYVSLSKGRHRSFSRWCPLLFYLFTFVLDAVDVTERLYGDFQPDIYSSDELTTFRLLISFGCFATFGVIKLKYIHFIWIILPVMLLATLQITAGYGLFELSETTRIIIGILRLSVILSFSKSYFFYQFGRASERKSSLAWIVSVMNKTREDNFEAEDLEAINLRQNLSEDQRKKLELMEKLASNGGFFDDVEAGKHKIPWRKEYIIELVSYVLVIAMSALDWGRTPYDAIPRIVVVDNLEFLSVVLLFLNETRVETVLFVRLLQIANMTRQNDRDNNDCWLTKRDC